MEKERVYITNVRYGTLASRAHILYAEVRKVSDDTLCIGATLDYCLEQVNATDGPYEVTTRAYRSVFGSLV